ncbi:MAG: hypothetical protein JSU00_12275 [Acidobacteria bacterium]|nr:hypothetical protein [Acidobacteriota bacterium]
MAGPHALVAVHRYRFAIEAEVPELGDDAGDRYAAGSHVLVAVHGDRFAIEAEISDGASAREGVSRYGGTPG